MSHNAPEIYMGSVLLERNRWGPDRSPSFRVSDWIDRFAEAGFDGIELWANHAALASSQERESLARSRVPVRMYNGYATFEGEDPRRAEDASLARELGARAIKFNVGNDPSRRHDYLDHLRAWREQVPANIVLLCECHPGTLLEEPRAARTFFDALGMAGYGIIVHPFSLFDSLPEWLALFGEAVVHAHLQMRADDESIIRFDRNRPRAAEAIRVLKDAGYTGSYTLEFTEGIGHPEEGPETLYAHALQDLATLRALLG